MISSRSDRVYKTQTRVVVLFARQQQRLVDVWKSTSRLCTEWGVFFFFLSYLISGCRYTVIRWWQELWWFTRGQGLGGLVRATLPGEWPDVGSTWSPYGQNHVCPCGLYRRGEGQQRWKDQWISTSPGILVNVISTYGKFPVWDGNTPIGGRVGPLWPGQCTWTQWMDGLATISGSAPP
jgi:hypothetical protein